MVLPQQFVHMAEIHTLIPDLLVVQDKLLHFLSLVTNHSFIQFYHIFYRGEHYSQMGFTLRLQTFKVRDTV